MNKKDLDTWNDLYLSVYGGEQLNEINVNRIARGTVNALKDFPAATMSQLQGQGANRSNDEALKRQMIRGENLRRVALGKETLDQKKARISQREADISKSQDAAIAAAEKAKKTPPSNYSSSSRKTKTNRFRFNTSTKTSRFSSTKTSSIFNSSFKEKRS